MSDNNEPQGLEITNPTLQEIKAKVDQYEKTGNRTEYQMAAFAIGELCKKVIELDEALKRQVKWKY